MEICLRGERPFKVCKQKSKFAKSIDCWSLLATNLSKIGFHKWSCNVVVVVVVVVVVIVVDVVVFIVFILSVIVLF